MAQFGSCCLERGVAFFHHGAEGAKGRISLADLRRSGQKKQSLNSGFKKKRYARTTANCVSNSTMMMPACQDAKAGIDCICILPMSQRTISSEFSVLHLSRWPGVLSL